MDVRSAFEKVKKGLPIYRLLLLLGGIALAIEGQHEWAIHHFKSGLHHYGAAGILCILALEVRRSRPGKKAPFEAAFPLWAEIVLLLGILAGATFLRLYRIMEVPPGFFVDETHQALEAARVLKGEIKNPFGTGWYQVPTLYFYYVSVFFRFLGISTWSMKFSTVFGAVLTILPLYFLAKQWFGRGIGLTLAALLATNRWHLTMSRWGMVEVLPPLLGAAAFCFLAQQKNSKNWQTL